MTKAALARGKEDVLRGRLEAKSTLELIDNNVIAEYGISTRKQQYIYIYI